MRSSGTLLVGGSNFNATGTQVNDVYVLQVKYPIMQRDLSCNAVFRTEKSATLILRGSLKKMKFSL
jgi:hypothetical protein